MAVIKHQTSNAREGKVIFTMLHGTPGKQECLLHGNGTVMHNLQLGPSGKQRTWLEAGLGYNPQQAVPPVTHISQPMAPTPVTP